MLVNSMNEKKADFVLELLCEEIPARMQQAARKQMQHIAMNWFENQTLSYDKLETYITPRRIALLVNGLPLQTKEKTEERRGPRIDAPQQALKGFCHSNNISEKDLSKIETPKGVFYAYVKTHPAADCANIMQDLISTILHEFKWPKSMRWGDSEFKWVRPLKSILAVFNGQKNRGNVSLAGLSDSIPVTDYTVGHRTLSPEKISVTSVTDYLEKLKQHCVILDTEERKSIIIAFTPPSGLAIDYNAKLLEEVAGLCEYPLPVLGNIDPHYVEQLPAALLKLTMAHHQKYFSVYQNSEIAPYFLTVADMDATDGNKAIIAGNERVLRARLQDALFLYQQDCNASLDSWNEQLQKVIFHQKLGNVLERVARIKSIAVQIHAEAEEAANYCKADLVSGVVGEFPELQGYMGQCYALQHGFSKETAKAIGQHYLPVGNNSPLPEGKIAQAVALADKLEILTSFFSINEKPTGSKDPFALRRAAYGILRILAIGNYEQSVEELLQLSKADAGTQQDVSGFIRERCLQWLKDQGVQHDVIAAANLYRLDNCHPLKWQKTVAYFDKLKTNESAIKFIKALKRVDNLIECKEGESYQQEHVETSLYEDKVFYESCRKHINYQDYDLLFKLADLINNYLDSTHINVDDYTIAMQRRVILRTIKNNAKEYGNFLALQV